MGVPRPAALPLPFAIPTAHGIPAADPGVTMTASFGRSWSDYEPPENPLARD